MGGRSYFRGGRRITYNGDLTWASGFFASLVSGWLFFFLLSSIYDLGSISFLSAADNILLGLSETRLMQSHSMWISNVGGGPVVTFDRTPLKVQMDDKTFDKSVKLMKFSQKPPLTYVDSWTSHIDCDVRRNDYYYWSWYFNKGTEISIEWEFFDKKKNNKEDINVYMVQSERGFDAFERWTESYAITSFLRKPFRLIRMETTSDKLTYKVEKDDFYFVFFWNTSPHNVSGSFDYSVTSTLYDVSNPDDVCSLPCYMPVNTNDVFILTTPSARTFSVSSGYSINTDFEFQPRFTIRWGTIGVILLSPMGLYLALLALWYARKYLYRFREM